MMTKYLVIGYENQKNEHATKICHSTIENNIKDQHCLFNGHYIRHRVLASRKIKDGAKKIVEDCLEIQEVRIWPQFAHGFEGNSRSVTNYPNNYER